MTPTQRQLDFIADIEEVVGESFTGTTKQEASVWIDEHLDDFRLIREHENNVYGAVLESRHGDWGNRDE